MPSKEIVGVIGHSVATYSHEYVGYISYVYLIGVLYLLYLGLMKQVGDIVLKSILSGVLFLSILIFQALVFEDSLSGKIGEYIVSFIKTGARCSIFSYLRFAIALPLISGTVMPTVRLNTRVPTTSGLPCWLFSA